MPEGIKNLVNRASSILDPSDPSLARRAISSTEPAPTASEALSNLSMLGLTRGVYDLGTGAIKGAIDFASDPYGTAQRGIASLGDYLKESYNLMGAAGMGSQSAVGPAFMRSLDIPGAGNIVGAVPEGSLAALVGRRSADPDIYRAYTEGEALLAKGVPPEEVFYRTSKMTPEYASGYQRVVPGFDKYAIEVYDPYEFKTTSVLDRVKSGALGKSLSRPVPLSQVIKPQHLLREFRTYPR
jgi:hypothetical protein